MEQKQVSFKVAKAIKKAGYQQHNCRHWYNEIGVEYEWYGCIEELESVKMDNDIDAPTYLDVWLWLWREKKIEIALDSGANVSIQGTDLMWRIVYQNSYSDPEEAIVAAIEYLVDNDLIK